MSPWHLSHVRDCRLFPFVPSFYALLRCSLPKGCQSPFCRHSFERPTLISDTAQLNADNGLHKKSMYSIVKAVCHVLISMWNNTGFAGVWWSVRRFECEFCYRDLGWSFGLLYSLLFCLDHYWTWDVTGISMECREKYIENSERAMQPNLVEKFQMDRRQHIILCILRSFSKNEQAASLSVRRMLI